MGKKKKLGHPYVMVMSSSLETETGRALMLTARADMATRELKNFILEDSRTGVQDTRK